MIVPALLFILSSFALALSLIWPNRDDFILISAPMVAASLYLLLRASFRRRPEAKAKQEPSWVIVDGSNVLYWRDQSPQFSALIDVVQALKARGLAPVVVFDANAGYLTVGKYQHDFAFARQLGLPPEQVMVVDKGTQADTAVLDLARGLSARIVTNDRYRDWAEAYPEVLTTGWRIEGAYTDGRLHLGATEEKGPTFDVNAGPLVQSTSVTPRG